VQEVIGSIDEVETVRVTVSGAKPLGAPELFVRVGATASE